jgi:hypothetical protein
VLNLDTGNQVRNTYPFILLEIGVIMQFSITAFTSVQTPLEYQIQASRYDLGGELLQYGAYCNRYLTLTLLYELLDNSVDKQDIIKCVTMCLGVEKSLIVKISKKKNTLKKFIDYYISNELK